MGNALLPGQLSCFALTRPIPAIQVKARPRKNKPTQTGPDRSTAAVLVNGSRVFAACVPLAGPGEVTTTVVVVDGGITWIGLLEPACSPQLEKVSTRFWKNPSGSFGEIWATMVSCRMSPVKPVGLKNVRVWDPGGSAGVPRSPDALIKEKPGGRLSITSVTTQVLPAPASFLVSIANV